MVEGTQGLTGVSNHLEAYEGQWSLGSSSNAEDRQSVWKEDDEKEFGEGDIVGAWF